MTTFYFAKLILAHASFSLTEDGEECLFWELPQGRSGHDELRVVIQDGVGLYAEERAFRNGVYSEWSVTAPSSGRPMSQTVTDCLRLLDSLGMDYSEVVGSGFNGESSEATEALVPKRHFLRG